MFHKRLLVEFKENKKYVMEMVLCKWIILLVNAAFLYGTALFLNQIYEGKLVYSSCLPYLLLTTAVILARWCANRIFSRLSFQASTRVKRRLREMVYEKLIQLGSGYKDKIATSEAVQISTEGVEQLEIYFGNYMPQFFYSLAAPVTLFILVGIISIKAAAILFLFVPLIPVSIIAVQKFAKRILNKYWGTYTGLGDSFLDSLNGLTTLKIYNADDHYAKKMDKEAEEFRKVTMRVLIMQLNSISVMDLVAYGGAALGIIFSILERRAGNISMAQCFFIIMMAAEFFLPMRLLGSYFHIAMNGNAAADKIFALLDQEVSVKGDKHVGQAPVICFEHVCFGYGEEDVVKDLSFEIKPSQFVAFVGESGCGKSTIASLLMGQYGAYIGRIRIGDQEITDIAEQDRYQTITRISHDSYIFKGTVRDNLQMGRTTATENELEEVLRRVSLYEMIQKNGGLDMQVLEKGSNLSGGQKQKLALARALLHDSPVLIFDEATSNVDVESENEIMEVIKELAREKTLILISHRLANVVPADRIYVMKKQENRKTIIEMGDHAELIRQNGYYKKIYERQKQLESYGREA